MAERILVVEDELNVGSTLAERLEREGFEVVWTRGVQETRDALKDRRFDLALLDVGLPDGSGYSLAESLRADHRATAIIFLTAHGNPEDRVRGLEMGAEDYIVKPFHLKELLLRIRRSLQRARYFSDLAGVEAQPVRVGQALIHFSKFSAEAAGVTHTLSHKECELLKLLVDRKGRVVKRDEILNHVWSENEFPSPRTIDNFIMRLRRIVEVDSENPTVIKSVRGVGYLLAEETES
jgi:DNA-binding response OmpR family regulator